MYTNIGSFEAKARLSELLREVRQGRRYTITLRGEAVADLIPSEKELTQETHRAVEAMRNIEKIQGVRDEEIQSWMTEGRR